MSETPKKKLPGRGRPAKQPSCNDFCRVCSVNFKTYYGEFNRNRVSTENLFEEPKRAGVEKCRLVDLLKELGFSCEKSLSQSNRVCSKCSTKIRNTVQLMRFLRSGFAASRSSTSIQCSPTAAVERFKQMSSSPHSANPGKQTRTASPKEKGVEAPMKDCSEKPTARRSITYDMSSDVTSRRVREEICDLMSMEEVDKPALRIIIPTGNDNFAFRSTPDATTANIVKNICNKNWKPVVNALFVHTELKDELLHCLSKNMAREMTGYIHSDSMLKYSAPSELAAFSNRKLVHEIEVYCPLWHACLTGAANVHLPGAKFDAAVNSLALASSVIARLRNPRMSALAKRVSTVLVHSGAKADDFMRLNRLGICMSHDQVIRDQVEAGKSHDSKVLLWKKSLEERNGTLFLIEEILNEQSTLDSVDVSKSALEGKTYYSSQAFEKLSRLLNSSVVTGNIKREDIEKAKSDLLNEEPAVSYRLERMRFFFNFITFNAICASSINES